MYDEFSASNSTGSFPVQRGIPNGPSSCHKTNPKVRYDGSISGTELHCHRHDIKISKRKQKQGACRTRSPPKRIRISVDANDVDSSHSGEMSGHQS